MMVKYIATNIENYSQISDIKKTISCYWLLLMEVYIV